MAALTMDRNTKARSHDVYGYPVAAGVMIWQGAMIALNASGYAKPADGTGADQVVGVAREQIDNMAGGNGDVIVETLVGAYKMENAGANTVAASNVGDLVYADDDQTVSTDGTNTPAGRCSQVDSDGVWVVMGPEIN